MKVLSVFSSRSSGESTFPETYSTSPVRVKTRKKFQSWLNTLNVSIKECGLNQAVWAGPAHYMTFVLNWRHTNKNGSIET